MDPMLIALLLGGAALVATSAKSTTKSGLGTFKGGTLDAKTQTYVYATPVQGTIKPVGSPSGFPAATVAILGHTASGFPILAGNDLDPKGHAAAVAAAAVASAAGGGSSISIGTAQRIGGAAKGVLDQYGVTSGGSGSGGTDYGGGGVSSSDPIPSGDNGGSVGDGDGEETYA